MSVGVSGRAADAVARAARLLEQADVDDPAREARRLLGLALGHTHVRPIDPDTAVPAAYWELIERRRRREPAARIAGSQGFWSLDLAVSPATLIPRADTETLIEAAHDAYRDPSQVRRILDLGTGTGALLLAALVVFPAAWGVGIDISAEACAVAQRNAERNGLAGRAVWVCGDWASCLAARFDLVLSNPPYVRRDQIPGLMPEVAWYEPHRALDGGADGLESYRALLADLPRLLAPDGLGILELGHDQSLAVASLARTKGLRVAGTRRDLAGLTRALMVRL